MAREDLIPMNKRTKEEQKKIATLGGIKSGEARREKKRIKEWLKTFSDLPAPPELQKKIKNAGYEGDDTSYGAMVAFQVMLYAIKGKAQYARLMMEMLEEAQPQGTVINQTPPVVNVNFVQPQDGES